MNEEQDAGSHVRGSWPDAQDADHVPARCSWDQQKKGWAQVHPLHHGRPRGKSSGSWISPNHETSRMGFRSTVWDSLYETEQAHPPPSRQNNASQVPTDLLLLPNAALNTASPPGVCPITKPDRGLPAQPVHTEPLGKAQTRSSQEKAGPTRQGEEETWTGAVPERAALSDTQREVGEAGG